MIGYFDVPLKTMKEVIKMEMCQTLKIVQKQKQSLTHRRLLKQINLTVITPEGNCPKCGHELTEDEIRAGWTTNPIDFTTQCPSCQTRFEANLLLTLEGKNVGTHTYLCKEQLFAELEQSQRGRSKILGKVFLAKKKPHLLWNLIRHFGTYEDGLAKFKLAQAAQA